MSGILKRFGDNVANDHVDLQVRHGEIHTLVGENGAGKTTLMNILYGLVAPDAGEIYLSGKKVEINAPSDAINLGIGMVHQHFMLVRPFTVAQNLILGNEPLNGWSLDMKTARRMVEEHSKSLNLQMDPDVPIEDLPVGMQQRVEILKLLVRDAQLLILDEPTAVLSPQETQELFGILERLRDAGKTVIFITHKLREVTELSDQITVLRDGRVTGEVARGECSERDLARMMVGRDVVLRVERPTTKAGSEIVELSGINCRGARDSIQLNDINFSIRAGEILGIAGVEGNGQQELVETIAGLRRATSGSIRLLGQEITELSPEEIRRLGVAHIPSDRQQQGLFLDFSLEENMLAGRHFMRPFSRHGVFDREAIKSFTSEVLTQYNVRPAVNEMPVSMLSGGNQQKLIAGRELTMDHKLLVATNPTRGVDIGAIEFIHNALLEKMTEGSAILLVSSELSEIMALSDRIAVMYKGSIQGIVETAKVSEEQIGLMMMGHRAQSE